MRKLSPLAVRPARVTPVCTAYYYQNGPFGSVAWSNGWGVCISSFGNYIEPFASIIRQVRLRRSARPISTSTGRVLSRDPERQATQGEASRGAQYPMTACQVSRS
jgi:hypothetical protein